MTKYHCFKRQIRGTGVFDHLNYLMSHSEPSKSFGIIPNCSEINPKWQVPEKWACSKPNDLSFSNYAWKSWTVIFHESRFLVYSRTFGLIRNNCGWTIHLEKEKSPFSPRKKGSRCFLTAVFRPRLNVVNIKTCIKNLFNEQMFAWKMFALVKLEQVFHRLKVTEMGFQIDAMKWHPRRLDLIGWETHNILTKMRKRISRMPCNTMLHVLNRSRQLNFEYFLWFLNFANVSQ